MTECLTMWIANCKICTLAEAMKDCPLCQFRVGLLEKQPVKLEESHVLDNPS